MDAEGTVCDAVGVTLTELQVILDLSYNNFSGQIPATLGNLVKLERLNLSLNQLQGHVPASLVRLTSLHRLNVSNNLLQGEIPLELSSFPENSFAGNELCGAPMGPCMGPPVSDGKHLVKAEVAGIIVLIVVISAAVCVALLYIMVRIWSNWRVLSVSSSDCEESNNGRWVGNGEKIHVGKYRKMGPTSTVVSGEEKHSWVQSRVLQMKSDAACY